MSGSPQARYAAVAAIIGSSSQTTARRAADMYFSAWLIPVCPIIVGTSAISKKQSVGPERLLWWAHDPFAWDGFNTIEEAKAAAQADYDARIRSALA